MQHLEDASKGKGREMQENEDVFKLDDDDEEDDMEWDRQ